MFWHGGFENVWQALFVTSNASRVSGASIPSCTILLAEGPNSQVACHTVDTILETFSVA